MTKTARKLFADLDELASADGTELLVVEHGGRKFKKTGAGGNKWLYKTANYTIQAGESVSINSGGTARTVTIAATIAAGDQFQVHHFNTSGTVVVVTIARNGHTLRYKGTDVADDITLDDGETVTIVASDSTNMEIV